MKKTLLLLLAFTGQASANDCPPAETLNFFNIHLGSTLGSTKEEVIKHYPNAEFDTSVMGKPSASIEFVNNPLFYGMYLTFDKEGHVDVIGLDYSFEGDYNTPLEKLRSDAIKMFNLPSEGWQTERFMSKEEAENAGWDPNAAESKFVCPTYIISVDQDFGAGKGSTGPSFGIVRPDL